MLELIRQWLLGITAAAMLVALAEALCPDGNIRGILRLTGGLVLLAAVLNPLLKLDTEALGRAGLLPSTSWIWVPTARSWRRRTKL